METIKKKLLFPFFLLWICIAYLIYKIGDLLRELGNRMSGYRFDNSVGKVYFD
jgi:hypothetical protein